MMVVSAKTATGAKPTFASRFYPAQALADLLYECDVTADGPALANGHR